MRWGEVRNLYFIHSVTHTHTQRERERERERETHTHTHTHTHGYYLELPECLFNLFDTLDLKDVFVLGRRSREVGSYGLP